MTLIPTRAGAKWQPGITSLHLKLNTRRTGLSLQKELNSSSFLSPPYRYWSVLLHSADEYINGGNEQRSKHPNLNWSTPPRFSGEQKGLGVCALPTPSPIHDTPRLKTRNRQTTQSGNRSALTTARWCWTRRWNITPVYPVNTSMHGAWRRLWCNVTAGLFSLNR